MGSNHIIAFWFRPGFTEHFRQFTVDARGVSCQVVTSLGVLHVYFPSLPSLLYHPLFLPAPTMPPFLCPFPKTKLSPAKPCWPIIQQIITRLMIENWRQSHSGRLKWSHNGRLMHFSEQIRKQSQDLDSVSLQINANKIFSSPPKIQESLPTSSCFPHRSSGVSPFKGRPWNSPIDDHWRDQPSQPWLWLAPKIWCTQMDIHG